MGQTQAEKAAWAVQHHRLPVVMKSSDCFRFVNQCPPNSVRYGVPLLLFAQEGTAWGRNLNHHPSLTWWSTELTVAERKHMKESFIQENIYKQTLLPLWHTVCPCTDGNCLPLPVTGLLLFQNIEEQFHCWFLLPAIILSGWVFSSEQSISRSFFFLSFFLNLVGILCVQITVTNVDGKPVADRTVLLELNEKYLANYTTNKNGTAAFSIDTSNFFDPSFKLSVSKCRLQSNSWENTLLARDIRSNWWALGGLFRIRKVGSQPTNTCILSETNTRKHQYVRSGKLHPRGVWAVVIFDTFQLFPPRRSPFCSHFPSLYSVHYRTFLADCLAFSTQPGCTPASFPAAASFSAFLLAETHACYRHMVFSCYQAFSLEWWEELRKKRLFENNAILTHNKSYRFTQPVPSLKESQITSLPQCAIGATLRSPEGLFLWNGKAQFFHTSSCSWLKQPHKISWIF